MGLFACRPHSSYCERTDAEHGWDYDDTRDRIKESFLHQFHSKENTVEGGYPGDDE